jgi:hypothetical protein
VKDVLFDQLNFTLDSDFVRVSAQAAGSFPVTWTGSNTIVQPNEFTGRNVVFDYGDYSGSKSAYSILSATLNHSFKRSDDKDNFALGSQDLAFHQLAEDAEFTQEVIGLESNRDNYDDFVTNTKKKYDFTITDTDRYVTASSASTRPSIVFDYAVGVVEKHDEDAPLDQEIKETLSLMAVDEVGVAGTPMSITVVNNIASY